MYVCMYVCMHVYKKSISFHSMWKLTPFYSYRANIMKFQFIHCVQVLWINLYIQRYHVSSWTASSWTGLGIGLGLGLGLEWRSRNWRSRNCHVTIYSIVGIRQPVVWTVDITCQKSQHTIWHRQPPQSGCCIPTIFYIQIFRRSTFIPYTW